MSIFLKNTYEYRLNKILNIILLQRSEINEAIRKKYRFFVVSKGSTRYGFGDIAMYSCDTVTESYIKISPVIKENPKLIDMDIGVEPAFFFEITLIEPKWSLFIGTILIRAIIIRPGPKKFIKEYKQNCYYYNDIIIFNVDKIYDFLINVHFCNL